MRVLDVHAEHCSFETVAAPPAEDAPDPEAPTPDPADDTPPAPREGGFDDCLVAVVAVEGDDAGRTGTVAEQAAAHLADRADELRLSRVLVYPCPALSEWAADRETAVEGCRALARALADHNEDPDEHGADLDVLRAPVGWHHTLSLSTAGHPFGESLNRFTGALDISEADSEWTVLVDGERHDADDVLPDLDEPVRAAFERAMEGPTVDQLLARGDDEGQPSLAEPDGLGGRRLLPAGRLVHDLLTDRVHERLLAFGAAPIETSPTVDPTDSDTARLLSAVWTPDIDERERRGARLRPTARLGALTFLRDAEFGPDDCPLRLCETGPIDRNGHATTVPTVTAAVEDRDAAWAMLPEFADLVGELAADCGLVAAPVCYAGGGVPDDRLASLSEALDRPVLVHRWADAAPDARTLRVEFHDERRDPEDVPHVRLDPTLGERAGIEFSGAGDAPAHPVVVDCEPLGSLDGARRACWDSPPAWLAPTQVRFVTVGAGDRDRATALADEVTGAGLRADVDDRARPVGERLDRAERDRVPFVVVVGDRERTDGETGLKVWDRRAGTERSLALADLVARAEDAVDGFPRRKRYLPPFVTDGPLRGTRDGGAETDGEK